MNKNEAAASRNYGIDLLRMVSMFLVAVLHTLGQGGVIGVTPFGTADYAAVWFLETAAYCSVNCYALISGYVCGVRPKGAAPGRRPNCAASGSAVPVGRSNCAEPGSTVPGRQPVRYKYGRFINLWLEVVFYTLGMTIIFAIVQPGSIGPMEISSALFPLLSRQYWYFNAYFVLYLFMPFINRLIEVLDKKELQRLVVAILVGFSLLPTIANKDIFVTGKGYSGLWIICLYIIGAYIKLYLTDIKLKRWQSMGLYIGCVGVAWLWKIVDIGQVRGLLIHYTSPFIVFAAIFLLLFFRELHFKGTGRRMIAFLSPAAFGVYLIHVNPLFWEHVMKKAFVDFQSLSPAMLVLAVAATAFCIYAAGTLIDLVRIRIFGAIKTAGHRLAGLRRPGKITLQ